MKCATENCNNEARMALRTTRTPSALKTQVFYDDREEGVPKSAEKICKKCGLHIITELIDVLVSEDAEA